jgi:hypothetical protein
MSIQLLDDLYAPITSQIGFLECDAKIAADAFQTWQLPIQAARGVGLATCEVTGDFPAKIARLLPLTSVEARRFVFLPTTSNWTAYFDNGWRGTDAFSTVSYLATTIGCRGIRAVSVPDTMTSSAKGDEGRFGATILEIYSADSSDCSFLNIRRSVAAINDGGRWRFDANGAVVDFEQLAHYEARRIRDRFTPEMLDDYLRAVGIHFFLREFYEPASPAYLISKTGPSAPGLKEYSLGEARGSFTQAPS